MVEPSEENLIRHFLLGRLPDEERERLELRLLADEDFLAEVDAVEDEVIDDFVLGRLDAADGERFKRQFLLTDERRERLRFARDFRHALAGLQPSADKKRAVNQADGNHSGIRQWPRRRRALAFGLALSLLLVGSFLLWRIFIKRNPRGQVIAEQERRDHASPNESAGAAANADRGEAGRGVGAQRPPARPRYGPSHEASEAPRPTASPKENRRAAGSVFVVALEPGNLRGEDAFKKISVPKGARTVLLTFRFSEEEETTLRQGLTCEVEIQNGEMKTIRRAANLRPSPERGGGRSVSVGVPAKLLAAGNYRATLRSHGPGGVAEAVGSYYFSVAESPQP